MSEPVALAITRRRSPAVFPLRIAGPLDLGAVEHVRAVLNTVAASARYILLQCDRVSSVDPAAAACLWDLCRRAERGGDQWIRLDGLPARFVRRLRLHPLLGYTLSEDELFADPFGQVLPSER